MLPLQFAKQFAQGENDVIATTRRTEDGDGLKELGSRVTVLQLDVTDQESIDAFAKEVAAQVRHVDVLINNAGWCVFAHLPSLPQASTAKFTAQYDAAHTPVGDLLPR